MAKVHCGGPSASMWNTNQEIHMVCLAAATNFLVRRGLPCWTVPANRDLVVHARAIEDMVQEILSVPALAVLSGADLHVASILLPLKRLHELLMLFHPESLGSFAGSQHSRGLALINTPQPSGHRFIPSIHPYGIPLQTPSARRNFGEPHQFLIAPCRNTHAGYPDVALITMGIEHRHELIDAPHSGLDQLFHRMAIDFISDDESCCVVVVLPAAGCPGGQLLIHEFVMRRHLRFVNLLEEGDTEDRQ